jgi:hypothetical protein
LKLLLELASIMHGLSHAYFTVRASQDSKHTKPTRVHALLPVTLCPWREQTKLHSPIMCTEQIQHFLPRKTKIQHLEQHRCSSSWFSMLLLGGVVAAPSEITAPRCNSATPQQRHADDLMSTSARACQCSTDAVAATLNEKPATLH